VTVFADLETGERRAVFVVEGRDQATVLQFKSFVVDHGGDPGNITEVCQDMSAAYLAGGEHFGNAQVTFDRFHVKHKLGEALDKVRRGEGQGAPGVAARDAAPVAQTLRQAPVNQLDWLNELLEAPLAIVAAYELSLRL
jgi:transposase